MLENIGPLLNDQIDISESYILNFWFSGKKSDLKQDYTEENESTMGGASFFVSWLMKSESLGRRSTNFMRTYSKN